MKTVLTALALVAGLAACSERGGQDSARVGESADTNITTRQEQDTTIVTSDTTVRTDTTVREGDTRQQGSTSQDTTTNR